jgi:hypothetical protein
LADWASWAGNSGASELTTGEGFTQPAWSAGSNGWGATASAGAVAADAVALGNLSWRYAVDVNASYNRSLGADRTTYVSEGHAKHTFDAPAACYSQKLVAVNGGVSEAITEDSCPLAAVRTQLCRRFDACGAGHAAPATPAAASRHAAGVSLMDEGPTSEATRRATIALLGSEDAPLLVRHPWRWVRNKVQPR